MSQPIPLFVELCAGTAAISLRLQQRKARPPVSRMGSKTGYADAILRVLGLRPGQRADAYLWCEPDPGCRLLLEAYRDRALALAAAEIIRGWKDEDPRALWERLRAEGPPVCPPADAREVARWVYVAGAAYRRGEPSSGFDAAHERVARGEKWGSGDPRTVAPPIFDRLPALPATIAPDARTVDPREVARWARIVTANRLVNPGWDEAAGDWKNTGNGGYRHGGEDFCTPIDSLAAGFDVVASLPATIADDARLIEPVDLPPGTVAYMDGPYEDTTGYGHLFPRVEQVEVARRWDAAGAVVCVSEAEPIPELVADGWHAVEITGARVGQKRTFGGTREWLTLNREPAWTVPVQGDLFG